MTIVIRRIAVLMIFLSSSLSASSLTFLVDTRDNQPRADMEMEQLIQVVSLETGVMDTLFDEGHIFFNFYTVIGKTTPAEADRTAIDYARRQGARYLLVLLPEDQGSSWKMYDSGPGSEISAGYLDISLTDPEKKTAERWEQLGKLLAEEVSGSIG